MADAPQINDRRRFKELWKELVLPVWWIKHWPDAQMTDDTDATGTPFAPPLWRRLLLPLCCGFLAGNVLRGGMFSPDQWFWQTAWLSGTLGCSFLRGVKLRDSAPWAAVAVLSFCAVTIMHFAGGMPIVGSDVGMPIFATLGAIVGFVNGMREGSLGALVAGMTGGAASGAVGGLIWDTLMLSRLEANPPEGWSPMIACALAYVVIHLGAQSSVTLGLILRDGSFGGLRSVEPDEKVKDE